ncbi:hypothetical protein [Acinetobacter bereziniae]|uniref:hypothetical protein n=1 Tax=Acinetobacter bereziniae TaxID=106648 RepID=UPI0032B40039
MNETFRDKSGREISIVDLDTYTITLFHNNLLVGEFKLEELYGEHLYVDNMYLIEDFQDKGIGTHVIERLNDINKTNVLGVYMGELAFNQDPDLPHLSIEGAKLLNRVIERSESQASN